MVRRSLSTEVARVRFRPVTCFSKVPKLFGPISGATIAFITSQRQGFKPSNFAILLVFLLLKKCKKINFFQNKRIAVWQLAFRALKVLRTFEKRAPGHHMRVKFVDSLVSSEGFFPGYPGFPLTPKTNIWFDLLRFSLICTLLDQ